MTDETNRPVGPGKIPARKINWLTSYPYFKNANFDNLLDKHFPIIRPRIFADSGAFTAFTQGIDLNIDLYAEWLLRWKHHFDFYVNLDVVGDPKQSLKNQRYLENQYGLKPLPVFHVGEDFEHLRQMITEYNYIALGGMASHLKNKKEMMPWLIQCFKIAEGKARFHGFGCTNMTVLTSLPWRSVDSSSWSSGFRWGELCVFNSSTNRIERVKLGDMSHAMRLRNDLARYGITPEQVGDRKQNTRQINAFISSMSFMDLQDYLSDRWGEYLIYLAEAAKSVGGTFGSFQRG